MNVLYKISIDRFTPQYISGWCYSRLNKQQVVNLCLRYNGEVISRAAADLFREDLLELGLHPTGRCGFELVVDPPADGFGNGAYTLTLAQSSHPLLVLDTIKCSPKKREGFRERLSSLLPSVPRSQGLILFMHIPKTAGTSFNTQIYTLFPRHKISTHIELEDKSRYDFLAKEKHFLSGHLRFGLFQRYFCQGNFQLYTIVREPYAHLHSHLKWMIKTAQEDTDNYFKYSNRIIYDLGKKLAETGLDTTERLEYFVETLSTVEARFFDNMQSRYFCDQEIERVRETELQEAIKNAKGFRLIGKTERYSVFLNHFIMLNKLRVTGKERKLNRSESKPLFDISDPEVREILHPLVRYDLQLYDHIDDLG